MSEYTIQPADIINDEKDIISLWCESFPETKGFEYKYNWLYKNNLYKDSQLFLLKNEHENISVGIQGISARCFEFNNKSILVGLVGDFAVSKQHRTLGPGLKLLKYTMTAALNSNDFIYSFPNINAVPVVKRSGYKLQKNINRYVKINRSEAYLARFTSRYIAKMIAPMIDSLIITFDTVRLAIHTIACKSEFIDEMDIQLNKLWREASFKDGCLLQCRTKNYIDWRSQEHISARINYFIIKDNKTMVGYIAYILNEKSKNILIVDFFAKNQSNYLKALFSKFVLAVRKKKVNSISVEFTGPKNIAVAVESVGFKKRDSRPVFYKFKEGSDLESNVPDIFLTAWDEDAV